MRGIWIYTLIYISTFVAGCSKDDAPLKNLYEEIDCPEIRSLESMMSSAPLQSTHGSKNQIPKNTILVFRTGSGSYGKMLILNNTEEGNFLDFSYTLFDQGCQVLVESQFNHLQQTYTFDFENENGTDEMDDFWWEWQQFHGANNRSENKYLRPSGNCMFYIYE